MSIPYHPDTDAAPDMTDHRVADLRARLAAAEAEVMEWRGCARYDPTMEGPAFKGWDRSALDRCRVKYALAAIRKAPPPQEG